MTGRIAHIISRFGALAGDFCSTGGRSAGGGGIIVFRVDAIGDYVLFRPTLRALRNSPLLAGKKIILCGNAVWRELAGSFDSDNFDEFVPLERGRFMLEAAYRREVFTRLRQLKPDTALYPVFSRDYIGDALVRASGARERIGFGGGGKNLSKFVHLLTNRYYTKLLPPQAALPFELYRNFEFYGGLTGSEFEPRPEFFRIDCEASGNPALSADWLMDLADLPMLCLGAAAPHRRWPAGNFAQLAMQLNRLTGKQIVLTGGADCLADAAQIEQAAPGLTVNLVGKTTLSEMCALLSRSLVFVANDSSAAHLGAASGAAGVIISNGQHMGRFHPYPAELAPRVRTVYPPGLEPNAENIAKLYWSFSDRDISEVRLDAVLDELRALLG